MQNVVKNNNLPALICQVIVTSEAKDRLPIRYWSMKYTIHYNPPLQLFDFLFSFQIFRNVVAYMILLWI